MPSLVAAAAANGRMGERSSMVDDTDAGTPRQLGDNDGGTNPLHFTTNLSWSGGDLVGRSGRHLGPARSADSRRGRILRNVSTMTRAEAIGSPRSNSPASRIALTDVRQQPESLYLFLVSSPSLVQVAAPRLGRHSRQ